MTAIMYPDCEATSANGEFTLEARSPHNGTIDHRDGTRPSEDEFAFKYREHQREFRYRLRLNDDGDLASRSSPHRDDCILWTRWQGKGEDSPHQLLVSDQGWSILRTHGFRPEVIAVSPDGKDSIRVRISVDGAEHDRAADAKPGYSWRPRDLAFTTAGLYWTGDSWPYFLDHQGNPLFCWRTSGGKRLLLDLGGSRVLTDAERLDADLLRALVESERGGARALLASIAPSMDAARKLLKKRSDAEGNPLMSKLGMIRPAIHLVGVHRIEDCLPQLRAWEEIDYPEYSTGSTAMRDGWMEAQYFRPILHHSLRLLAEEPTGLPTYHFLNAKRHRIPMPWRIPDRRSRSLQLDREMSARQVLERVGSPDHIEREAHQIGKSCRWTEQWEYDFLLANGWVTMRITWEERDKSSRIASIDEIPSDWLRTDGREWKILRN